MTRALRCGLLACAVALSGCTTLPQDRLPGELISGRLSVRVDAADGTAARSLSAAFELQGSADQGRLDLASPLGTMLAQVRWSRGIATLSTPDNTSPYPDLDALTLQLLGESVPVAAWFDWLRGRPWPAAPSAALPDTARLGFSQLDWHVDLAGFNDALVVARRDRPPAVTVRAKIDRP